MLCSLLTEVLQQFIAGPEAHVLTHYKASLPPPYFFFSFSEIRDPVFFLRQEKFIHLKMSSVKRLVYAFIHFLREQSQMETFTPDEQESLEGKW